MRTDWIVPSIVLLTAGLFAAGADRSERDHKTDPDAGTQIEAAPLGTPTPAGLATANGDIDTTCLNFGAYEDVFGQTNRFKGNVYRILEQGVTLRQIEMELQFRGLVDLHFSVHKALITDEPQVFEFEDGDIRSFTGDATRQFFSSRSLDIPLPVGFDYIIGVGWSQTDGVTTTVGFGRSSTVHPQPFVHGKVMGLVSLSGAPPLADELAGFTIFTNFGVYSFNLCFDSVDGACCSTSLGGDNCGVILETNCSQPGSLFHGERSTCAAGLCTFAFGACCTSTGDCLADYTREACEAAESSWAGSSVACPPDDKDGSNPLCPVLTGACCTGTTCSIISPADCGDAGGVYRGHDTDCFPNFCAGACCIPDLGCADLDAAICGLLSGAYRGDGTTCDALDPADECGGACCTVVRNLGPSCFVATSRDQCVDGGDFTETFYLGDTTICSQENRDVCETPSTVDRGACCTPNGSCHFGTGDFCNDSRGFFNLDQACDAVSCDVACCFGIDDSCVMTSTPAECTGVVGGSVLIDISVTCVPNLCGEPIGACCFLGAADPCEIEVTQRTCDTAGGRFFDSASDCDICPADLGSCCLPNGLCADNLTVLKCTDRGGDHQRNGTCEDAACPQLGACCTDTGECILLLPSQCNGIDGIGDFLGEGANCQAGSCPTGACCSGANGLECGLNEGICDHLTQAACGDREGATYSGSNTRCDDSDVCCGTEAGACCLDLNACEVLTPQECFDFSGVFQGVASVCDEENAICTRSACCVAAADTIDCLNGFLPLACREQEGGRPSPLQSCISRPCDLVGACCNNFACTLEIGAECFGAFQGIGTTCDTAPCAEGACCELSSEILLCRDNARPEECNSDGATFHTDTACVDSPCQPRGACCDAGSCSIQLRENCADSSKHYFGDNTSCESVDCNPGACCTDGQCRDVIEAQCVDALDVFLGAGSLCGDAPCTLGSCCLIQPAGECIDTFADDCDTRVGDFRSGVTCSNGPACDQRGACCLDDGSCADDVIPSDCQTLGGTPTSDALCAAITCDPVGACCLNGTCSTRTQVSCATVGGVYQGEQTVCTGTLCQLGTCCHFDATCQEDTVASQCSAASDEFRTDGSFCISFCGPRGACCVPDLGCQELTPTACATQLGDYAGDGVICEPDSCIAGACCDVDKIRGCTNITRIVCETAGLSFRGGGTVCGLPDCELGSCCRIDGTCAEDVFEVQCPTPDIFRVGQTCGEAACEGRGACCQGDQCQLSTFSDCIDAEGTYGGDATLCTPDDLCQTGACCLANGSCATRLKLLCEQGDGVFLGSAVDCVADAVECLRGACCNLDASCQDDTVTENCTAEGSEFIPDTTCFAADCDFKGGCCRGGSCTMESRANCITSGGIYTGPETVCSADLCVLPTIVATIPALLNCSIDAGQPSDPSGLTIMGPTVIGLQLSADASGLTPTDFEVTIFPGSAIVPIVTEVASSGDQLAVTLDPPAPPQQWTCVNVMGMPERACVGFLPGDANSNRITEVSDVIAVIDCLTHVFPDEPCHIVTCDIDRSSLCHAGDILRLVDLLNAADSYEDWTGRTLTGDCPTTLP